MDSEGSADSARTRRIAEQIFAARARGDLESALDAFDEDAVIKVEGAGHVPTVGEFKTPEQRRYFFTDAHHTASNVSREVRAMLVDGADAIVLGTSDFLVEATGRHYGGDWALHLHVEGEKVSLWQMYQNTLSVSQAFDAGQRTVEA